MSKHQEAFESDLSSIQMENACRRAISDIGWRILEDSGSRIVVKEVSPQATNFTWAAKAELLIRSSEPGSEIQINGSITGMGPIQKGHLKGQVGALRNKIELAAQDGELLPASQAEQGLSGELTKLAELRDAGVLSEEEFAQAKRRALEGPSQ